jgi:zinc/manganese transport system substrate-binding protein
MKRGVLLSVVLIWFVNNTFANTIQVVSAENFYGQLAKEIGGNAVSVTSIINNPNVDPHIFTVTPSVIKLMNSADVIIYNGDNYDTWMNQLISNVNSKKVKIINVASLMKIANMTNPHIWYIPDTFPTLAKSLSSAFISINPQAKINIDSNLKHFLADNKQVQNLIILIQHKTQNTIVTATEPVYNYMLSALGFKIIGIDFQWKIMNDTEPTPKMMIAYQKSITNKQVHILFYNSQVANSITQNMRNLAISNHIPIIGVTETMPEDTTINKWLYNQLLTLIMIMK